MNENIYVRYRSRNVVLVVSLLIGLWISGLAWGASKEKVVIYHATGIDTLSPYAYTLGPAYGLWEHVLEPLVEVDLERKEYVPKLAESWEFKGKEWVFKLRKGIKFHDGSPLTARDVVYSFNRIKNDKRSLQKRLMRVVTEVSAPDDYTVILKTKKPTIVLLDNLKNRFIISKTAAEKYGEDVDKLAIGTGPYKFKSFERDGDLVLERNDEYWGPKKPQIKTLIWRKVTEVAARVAALEAGQADVINAVSAHEIARLEKNPRLKVASVSGQRNYFLAINPYPV